MERLIGLLRLPVAVACAALAPVLLGGAAAAQALQCAGMADALANLQSRYGEIVVWDGETGNGPRLLVTARPDGTSWTALAVEGAVACMLTSGTAWTGTLTLEGGGI